jgi:TctA family transporter
VAIVTMSAMAIFAGDIPAALVRIPGTPSSAAYTDDSYELTKQGKAELVLGVDVVTSAIGGLMGAVVLMIAAPLLAEVALRFTSFEYFWLAALGLSATVMIASTLPLKAGLALLLGLFFSTIGVDITLGYPRFTFGTTELLNGLDFIPAMIGLFGVSEVLRNMGSATLSFRSRRSGRADLRGGETLWRTRPTWSRRRHRDLHRHLPGRAPTSRPGSPTRSPAASPASRRSSGRGRSSRSWTPGPPTTPVSPATGCRRSSSASRATRSPRS